MIEVRDREDLAAVRRPVNRVVFTRAGGEQSRRSPRDIDDEDLAPPVVVESRSPSPASGL